MNSYYFSKLSINATNLDIYGIHQTLWKIFPNRPDEQRSFLFSIIKKRKNNIDIFLRSEIKPEGIMPEIQNISIKGPVYFASKTDQKKESIIIQRGSVFSFKLVANPTKKIKDSRERKNKKGETKKNRVPLIHHDELKNWLMRKFDDVAEIKELYIREQEPLYFKRKNKAGKIQSVIYEGLLKINDENGFLNVYTNGIGSAKAFGCGLLLLKRI